MIEDPTLIENPTSISLEMVAEKLSLLKRFRVQFSDASYYSPRLLRSLNDICIQSPEAFQVRFYGHFRTGFDAAVLSDIPDVKSLAIDCMRSIHNEDAIPHLREISSLHFAVFDFERRDFLRNLAVLPLTSLMLGETRKRRLDLSPLSDFVSVQRLFIEGHGDGIDAVGTLPNLRKITLRSIAKNLSLAFLKSAPSLQHLSLVLGGRADIKELASETISELQIVRVLGLQGLGDLSRLPSLRHLWLEDQAKIDQINLSGVQLAHFSAWNCKTLEALYGLELQDKLREFQVGRVALDLDKLRDWRWPDSVSTVRLFSGSRRWNEITASELSLRGYSQEPVYHHWNGAWS